MPREAGASWLGFCVQLGYDVVCEVSWAKMPVGHACSLLLALTAEQMRLGSFCVRDILTRWGWQAFFMVGA